MRRGFYNPNAIGTSAVCAMALFAITTSGAVLTTLYSFTDGVDGAIPTGIIQESNSNFYGSTVNGGTNGWGTVFQISPSGAFTPVYSFTGGFDGGTPSGAPVQGWNGNLFGATQNGGANGQGNLYTMTPSGSLSSLHPLSAGAFNAQEILTNADGAAPVGLLAQGEDGYFYGAAASGGPNGFGTLFKLSAAGQFTRLYPFTNGKDGAGPTGSLVQGTNGNFYGTATGGGSNMFGTIFEIATNGNFNALYSFTNGADGASPASGLVQGANGNLYGVTPQGGLYANGTVFEISPSGHFTALYSFGALSASAPYGNNDGTNPVLLTGASDGNFYGATSQGGVNDTGSLFRMTPGGALSPLYSFSAVSEDYFTNATGASPNGLGQGLDGLLYGTTDAGGTDGNGTVFSASLILSFSGASAVQYVNGQAILQLTGVTGTGTFIIDASTDLKQWTPILTNSTASGQSEIIDPNAANYPHRFYRARIP